MKPIYTRYETSNLLEDLGEDVVHFVIYFKTEVSPEVRLGIHLPYRKLVYFIEETNYPTYEYLTKIRSSMSGYGPKETKVMAKIEQEGLDLEPFLKNYLESKDEVYITQHLEWIERISSTESQETAKKIVETINNEIGENYASRQIKWHNYIDELDQTIHELTFRYYPEIFEKEEEKIKDYRNALISATLDFSRRIDKILNVN
jgi:hypothetical protein